MTMKIDLSLLDGRTPASELKAWLAYAPHGGDQSFELLVQFFDASDQRKRYREDGEMREDAWLVQVKDWRDIVDRDGNPVPFNRDYLRRLFDLDPYFGGWLMRECQRLNNFRLPSQPAAAG